MFRNRASDCGLLESPDGVPEAPVGPVDIRTKRRRRIRGGLGGIPTKVVGIEVLIAVMCAAFQSPCRCIQLVPTYGSAMEDEKRELDGSIWSSLGEFW